MNYNDEIWYSELYRIFSDNVLITPAQAVQLGQCLRAIQAGENAQYHLNKLYYDVSDNKDLQEALDRFIHQYIAHQKEEHEDDKNQ